MMRAADAGSLPVTENGRLIGIIAIRAVAEGKSPETSKVRDVMSEGVQCCFQDEEVGEVAHHMGDSKVRRLPVLDRNERMVGIVSLGDVATQGEPKTATEALTGCCQ
jgi:CBS domain-containing protein